jgi:hypoxanthine phosphoribosyltransferase
LNIYRTCTILARLKRAGLKVNANKSFFAEEQLEYLGYWITQDGIQPAQKKVAAIQNISAPKSKKELRWFIGMVSYYRDMWVRRSDILAPLASLTSKTAQWKWTDEHQKAFNLMKRLLSKFCQTI